MIQYFDKSRMEINDPNADPNTPWFVTNGLLVSELIDGKVQVGFNKFIPLGAANIPFAGDPDNRFPTYASLIRIFNAPVSYQQGDHITSVFLPEGSGEFPQYANSPATEIVHSEKGFGIPRAFWEYMNRTGTVYENGRYVRNQRLFDWLFVIGLPDDRRVLDQGEGRRRRERGHVPGVRAPHPDLYAEQRPGLPRRDGQRRTALLPVALRRAVRRWREGDHHGAGRRRHAAGRPQPTAGARLRERQRVRGRIGVRLKNKANGADIAKEFTDVIRADAGKAGPFEATLNFGMPAADTPATLEVFTASPRDGSETVLDSFDVVVSRPVVSSQ